MDPIEYDIKAIRQKTSECMQTAATQLLSFYDPAVKLEDVIMGVPVYVENGEKVGTSPGHMAAYLAQQGYETTVFIFDTELFDRSWKDMSPIDVVSHLKERQSGIPANSWLSKYHPTLVAGWELFVKSGGKFAFPILSTELLRKLLAEHPFLIMLSSTYLNQSSKQLYDQATDKFIDDPVQGRSITHTVTCAGYKDNSFLIVDPDPPADVDQHRWIPADHLIASIMAAQTESDNLLIVINKS